MQKALLKAVIELADADEDADDDARVGGARRSAAATAAAPAAPPGVAAAQRWRRGQSKWGQPYIDLSHAETYVPKFL